jgi:hypothetical protein
MLPQVCYDVVFCHFCQMDWLSFFIPSRHHIMPALGKSKFVAMFFCYIFIYSVLEYIPYAWPSNIFFDPTNWTVVAQCPIKMSLWGCDYVKGKCALGPFLSILVIKCPTQMV